MWDLPLPLLYWMTITFLLGPKQGYMYALDADQWYGHSRKAKWQFKANGGINRKAEVRGDKLFFGANDGTFYCLDKHSGALLWKTQTRIEARAFRHFSTPCATERLVVVGSASFVYTLRFDQGEAHMEEKHHQGIYERG